MARNEESMQHTVEALETFAKSSGSLQPGHSLGDNEEDTEAAIADFLADVQHYCDAADLNFEQILGRASGYYNDEV